MTMPSSVQSLGQSRNTESSKKLILAADDNPLILGQIQQSFESVRGIVVETHRSISSLLKAFHDQTKSEQLFGVILDVNFHGNGDHYNHCSQAIRRLKPMLVELNKGRQQPVGIVLHTDSEPSETLFTSLYEFREIIFGYIQKENNNSIKEIFPYAFQGHIKGQGKMFWMLRGKKN